MRKSIGHCLLIAAVAMAFSSVGTGCKTGGWSMPGASWVSWGKKKPPTSSIAGTREATQPPSITIPPYPPSGPSPESGTALATYPSTGSSGANMGSTASSIAGGAINTTQPSTESAGFAVGPYSTSTPDPTGQPTQQGFYQNSTSPETATADARNGYGPTFQPNYGTTQPNSTYSAPSGYGAETMSPTGYGAPTNPYSAPNGYAGNPTPPSNYSGVPGGMADAAYPANPGNPTTGDYSAPAATGVYPTAQYPGAYPATNDPYGPNTTAATTPYGPANGGAPQPVAPTGYGPETPVYSASSQNSAYGTPAGSDASTQNADGSNNAYRPGSTGRNANLLSPSGSTRMATPTGGTTYPNTYYNR